MRILIVQKKIYDYTPETTFGLHHSVPYLSIERYAHVTLILRTLKHCASKEVYRISDDSGSTSNDCYMMCPSV